MVTQLEISKAFDTIPHEVIGRALEIQGIAQANIHLIENSYINAETILQNGSDSIRIKLQRGVKQGDPLSPTLFNLVFDPLICSLEKRTGYDTREENISVLAFADDIALTSRTRDQAGVLLNITAHRVS